jgi:hypothetical protein
MQAPQPPDSWEGIRDALNEGSVAPQIDDFVADAYLGEEDCLYVNVYTPKVRVTQKANTFLGAFGKPLQKATVSFVVSVRLSVHMEQKRARRLDFCAISYLGFFTKMC